MTQALPAAPQPPPRRQVLIGTALGCAAGTMLVGGMLAVWILMRERVVATGEPWVPEDASIPEVPSNIMFISFFALLLFAQWAVHAMKRRQRVNTGLALGTTAVVAIAIINAQGYVYSQMELPIAGSGYGPMFYSITGVFLVLMVIGLGYTGVAAFRVLGGREDDELVISHALYWYFVAAAFAAIWLFVYVTK